MDIDKTKLTPGEKMECPCCGAPGVYAPEGYDYKDSNQIYQNEVTCEWECAECWLK